MKRKAFFPFVLAILSMVMLPLMSWAGGVVQEFRTATGVKVGKSSNALTASVKPQNELANPTQTKVPLAPPKPFQVRYDKEANVTILSWAPLFHQGQAAVKYHIYRWSVGDTNAKLLDIVNGSIFSYIDGNYDPDVTYFYKIVGIYRVDNDYVSRPYPVQQLVSMKSGGDGLSVNIEGSGFTAPANTTGNTGNTGAVNTESPNPPSVGMGCSLNSQGTAPLGGLLLLLLLFLVPFSRRRSHLS